MSKKAISLFVLSLLLAWTPIHAQTNYDSGGDGMADILWHHQTSGNVWLYEMNGSFIQRSAGISVVPDTNWKIVGRGDYNGDGKSDILWHHQASGNVWLYEMDGNTITTSIGISVVPDTDWRVVGSGDYNGDGKSDILWQNSVTGLVWLYSMDGNSITSSHLIDTITGISWKIVGSGDFDGDGDSDIVWHNTKTRDAYLYRMQGGTIDSIDYLSGGGNAVEWQIAITGDYNGDSKSDLLWYNTNTGQVWLNCMDGNLIDFQACSGLIDGVPGLSWRIAGGGDYDGNGTADILWRYQVNGRTRTNLMDGLTITGSADISTVPDPNWQVVNTR